MSGFGRRDFLKIGALAAGAAACRGGIIRTVPIFRTGPDLTAAAATNYQESLKALRRTGVSPAGTEAAESGTGRLSLGPDELRAHRDSRPGQPDFDVLIIGSGYGGAVCAARLAAQRKPGVKIAVLERGQEWVPGTFPFALTNFSPFSRQSSWLRQGLSRNPLGLFGFHNQGDLTVVTGSGLGGTSLINCAVVIETEEAVFQQAAWPEELRSKERLRPYYDRAQRMLAPQRTPEDRLSPKLKTHLATAAALNKKGVWKADAYAAPLAITFSDRTNAQGMRQHGCVECGDCSTGCNVGAKHSLDMNYLPLAWSGGAMMFTQTEVDRVEKAADHYRVHCTLRSSRFSEDRDVVTARMVILAAGTVGTNEILLRSRETNGLVLSDRLGKGFSSNGNYLWFVDYEQGDPAAVTNSAGVGVVMGTPKAPVGPSIQGIVDSAAAIGRWSIAWYSRISRTRARSPAAWACWPWPISTGRSRYWPVATTPPRGRSVSRTTRRPCAGQTTAPRRVGPRWPLSWPSTPARTADGAGRSRRATTPPPTRSAAAAWRPRRPTAS